MEKQPECRYLSAEDLAADLERYLDGEAILARSYNVLARLTRALHKPSHREADLRLWANLLLVFGVIFLVGHALTFALLQNRQPYGMVLISRAGQLLLGGAAFWWFRRRSLLPANAAERQVWLIWLGALAAFGISSLAIRLLIVAGVLAPGPDAPASWQETVAYPFSAVVSGLAFFAMGGNYGGTRGPGTAPVPGMVPAGLRHALGVGAGGRGSPSAPSRGRAFLKSQKNFVAARSLLRRCPPCC